MKPLSSSTHWLWTTTWKVAALTWLVATAAVAEEDAVVRVPTTQNPYVPAVAALYEVAKYEEALSKLEKALSWKGNEKQEVLWLKLMQGVLQAELAQGAALASFQEALGLDSQARLPVKEPSRRLLKLFEQARDTAGLPTDAQILAEELEDSGPPPRRQGWSVGVRGEVDVLGLSVTNSITPVVGLGYTREKTAGVVTVLVQPSPGLRAEGQYHPLTLGWVRPYARLGATAFFREQDAEGSHTFFGGASGRVALGVDVQWNSSMSAFADVAYERFFVGGERYRTQAVLFSLGVSLFP